MSNIIWDFADGTVSILDFVLEASSFGQAIPPAAARKDQNADAAINIQDFVNFAHVEGIKKDQLGEAILGKDFFPKLN